MTQQEILKTNEAIYDAAYRSAAQIRKEARDIGERIGLGRGEAFHLAHNATCGACWRGFEPGTENHAAAKRILELQAQSFAIERAASEEAARNWTKRA